ncbi:MAG: hypothetical protein Q4G05_01390 [Clostridia bacterium]|nr:hypothetical protein [Clostridia bacterium]
MKEYIGKIDVLKETMLFVTNEIFGNNIKESTTKEDILNMLPEIYTNADTETIIKMLPYDSYKMLKKLVNYAKESNDIKTFLNESNMQGAFYLQEAMIIILRAKYGKYNYSVNGKVLEILEKIFTEENEKIAERYGEMEKLIWGMLYSYGVVEENFFRKMICKYMKEMISPEELEDFLFIRLNLNNKVFTQSIKWTELNKVETFITYLDEEYYDVENIIIEQKSRGLKYKIFSKEEILKRKEDLWDDKTKEFFKVLKDRNIDVWEYSFKKMLKNNELGFNITREILDLCECKEEKEIQQIISIFNEWYNNSPQYYLGGYSPIEFANT